MPVSERQSNPPAGSDDACGIAQAVGVLGDPWAVLVLRDVAGGRHRFEGLLAASGISRRTLTLRLTALLDAGLLERRRYSDRPPRHEYHLTERGRGALPVLAALQEFGDTWLLGDGAPSLLTSTDRLDHLVGTAVPIHAARGLVDPDADRTVVYCYPGTGVPGLAEIAGGVGCTLESCTYRDRLPEFAALGAVVVGVSTQTPDEQAAFAAHHGLQFPLRSDADLVLTTALRLPVVRVGGVPRLHRLTLVVDRERTIREVLHPITDVTGSVEEALAAVRRCAEGDGVGAGAQPSSSERS